MRKRIVFLISLMILNLGLIGCSKNQQENVKTNLGDQRGFIDLMGNQFIETPEGYYAIIGNYLIFFDEEMQNFIPVCNKPDCLHNQEEDDEVIHCNAFVGNASAIQYHDDKLYILAGNLDHTRNRSVMEVSLDGETKRRIYAGGEQVYSMDIYKDDILLYEKKFTEENKNPIISIIRFPIANPEKAEIVYENDSYTDPEINNFIVYKDYCYFRLDETIDDSTFYFHGMKIDLKSNVASDCCGFANTGYLIGKDHLICTDLLDFEPIANTGISKYYECTLEGEKQREITSEDYAKLDFDTYITLIDDEYVYLADFNNGGWEVPADQRYIYVYTYDGELKAKIPTGDFSIAVSYLAGNDKYLLVTDVNEEGEKGKEYVYYVVDKAQFKDGAEVKAREIMRASLEDYTGFSY